MKNKADSPPFDFLRLLEWVALIAAGLLLLWLHAQKMRHAGALWRDEANSVNIATLPSISDLWAHMRYDSFPVLWFLVLRFWAAIGLGNDTGFQLLGFFVGIGLLASTWLSLRLLNCRRPLLAVVLIGFNVTIFDWGDSMRAWGLGAMLIVSTFGLIWKVVEQPSLKWTLLAAIFALLSVHCIYYNSLLLFAICTAAALVCLKRKAWKQSLTILAIGFVAALSLLPYLSTMRAVKENQVLLELPGLKFSWFIKMLVDSLSVSGKSVPWIWGILLVAAIAAAGFVFTSKKSAALPEQRGLISYAVGALLIGLASYFIFLKSLKYATSPWYYIALMAFVAVAMETVLTMWEQWKSFRIIRLLMAAALIGISFPNLSKVAKERRTNVDVIAAELGRLAAKDDLIIVNSWYYAVPFERYYRGVTPWVTVPPISDHRVHRYDLIKTQMVHPDQSGLLQPVFAQMKSVLQSDRYVWIVGGVDLLEPGKEPRILPPAPQSEYGWREPAYSNGWSKQLGYFIQTQSSEGGPMPMPQIGAVSRLEELPVIAIRGWR